MPRPAWQWSEMLITGVAPASKRRKDALHTSESAGAHTKPTKLPVAFGKMKSTFIAVLFASIVGTSAFPNPQVLEPRPCDRMCRLERPLCPAGEAPTGSEGCWGCCQPVRPVNCLAVCRIEKPACPSGQFASGMEGCWGCCVEFITPTPTPTPTPTATVAPTPKPTLLCPAICIFKKPDCGPGRILSGSEGCWTCCVEV